MGCGGVSKVAGLDFGTTVVSRAKSCSRHHPAHRSSEGTLMFALLLPLKIFPFLIGYMCVCAHEHRQTRACKGKRDGSIRGVGQTSPVPKNVSTLPSCDTSKCLSGLFSQLIEPLKPLRLFFKAVGEPPRSLNTDAFRKCNGRNACTRPSPSGTKWIELIT